MNTVAPKNSSQKIQLSGFTGYNAKGSAVYAVPENFLNVINAEYYFPTSVQPNIETNKTYNRRPNAVDLLYSTEGQFEYDSNSTDYYNITTF